ncbi:MAG: hypothetical protein MJ085_06250 [Clostridia bacterium]|nr:hypothetical protein [Clostridia bacterium]
MFRFREAFRRYMFGRYGNDKLNMFLLLLVGIMLLTSVILSSVVRFFPMLIGLRWACYCVELLSLALFGYALFRVLSRNIAARQRENRAYLRFRSRLSDREHRYYACPKCNQTVRVPKGRGKIRIKCPSCAEQFIKKT